VAGFLLILYGVARLGAHYLWWHALENDHVLYDILSKLGVDDTKDVGVREVISWKESHGDLPR